MLREIVINLLHNLGGRAEVDRYLREYTQGGNRFAVIKVGGGLIADDLDELSSALVFLHHVGLTPVVVHGGGPQLTEELASQQIESKFIDGLRVTTDETLHAAQRVFQRTGATLADAIDARGCRARPVPSGVFRAVPTDRPELGHVGEVEHVETEHIVRAAERGHLPILSPVGTTHDGRLLNINADTAARALALALKARKVIYLTPTGGILDPKGNIIPAVDTAEDLEEMIAEGVVSGGMARKLIEIDELLKGLDEHASVSITAPNKIARELFTYKGSGTLVRRGTPIRTETGLDGLDRVKITSLLERSFNKRLDPAYLDKVGDAKIYVGGDYTAIAIIKSRDAGHYLDKLGINEQAQGLGLGATLWNRIRHDHPRLYWRSRVDNPANKWYLGRADGMHRTPEWLVFWYGLESRDQIETCIADALSFGHSFTAHPVETKPTEPKREAVHAG
ncbi:MAG: acetylglutamate kinase [Phycisphaeraceae bacterium]|nr:MAG: acetylglutamate kinase [Phycisphaeraceae bacterium]